MTPISTISPQRIRKFFGDLRVLCRALPDPEVPWFIKLLLVVTVAYVVSPIDIIPDFIPVLGLLDEVVLVPLAVKLAMRLMPPAVLARYAAQDHEPAGWRKLEILGAVLVAVLWLVLLLIALRLLDVA